MNEHPKVCAVRGARAHYVAHMPPALHKAIERIFDAAERGDVELLRQCLAAGVAVDIPDKRKSPNGVPTQLTPLHWACRQGQVAAASALLDAGASITYAT